MVVRDVHLPARRIEVLGEPLSIGFKSHIAEDNNEVFYFRCVLPKHSNDSLRSLLCLVMCIPISVCVRLDT